MARITDKITGSKGGWIILLLVLLGVNFLAAMFHARIDLTKEKRYTLSKTTKDLLRGLDEPVEIDVFLKGEFNAGFRKLANSTEEFMGLLKDEGGARVIYRFIGPEEEMSGTGKSWGDTLVGKGAIPINLTVQAKAGETSNIIFPVALIRYKGREQLVNIYESASVSGAISQAEINNAEAALEYQFAKALDGLTDATQSTIAYSFGNGEPTEYNTMSMTSILSEKYRLNLIDLNVDTLSAASSQILMIVKPTTGFSEGEKLKIDQFVMQGGKLLLFIDNLIAEQDSLRFKPEIIAYDRNLNLTDMFFKYGFRINPSLVMDLQCDFLPFAVGGTEGSPQFEFLHWNYYPLFESKSNHVINRNLGLVAGRFVNSIDTIATPGINKQVLLSSSPNSRVIATPALISLNENRNAPQDANFNRDAIPVALLLEGSFPSNYKNRITRAQQDSLRQMGLTYKDQSEPNRIIVVADGDMVLNDVSPKDGPVPMGTNLYTVGSQYQYTFANAQFLQNCLEYLVNKPAIMETRNKNIVLRLLDGPRVRENKLTWQLINIALPIVLIIIAGLIYQFIRRNKYARG